MAGAAHALGRPEAKSRGLAAARVTAHGSASLWPLGPPGSLIVASPEPGSRRPRRDWLLRHSVFCSPGGVWAGINIASYFL